MKKIITIIVLILTYLSTYGQVNVTISNMQYINGTPINNCGIIDFSTNPTVRVQFTINLTKQANQAVGTSNLYVYTIGSSGTRIERKNEIVQTVSFGTNYQSSADITMNASDFNTSGGTFFAVFKTSGNIEYQTTCSFSITKINPPTFTLSPSALSIPCGSIDPVTFSYSNVYNTPGVTYNFGYSGWTFVSSTPNSITLKPSSSSVLPSNFTLIPLVNGVTQPSKVCTVSRAPFNTNSQIIGTNVFCPGTTQTFNLSNSGSFASVNWSIAELGVASITAFTNNSVTIQAQTIGNFTVNANVTNSCGQTKTITRTFTIGVPSVNPNLNKIYGLYDWYAVDYNPFSININPVNNATSYVWTVTGSSNNANCSTAPKFSNGSTTMTTSTSSVTLNIGGCTGNYVVNCRPANSCGISFGIQPKSFEVGNPQDNPCDNDPIGLKMVNPIKEDDEILLNIHHSDLPCDTSIELRNGTKLTKEELEKIEYTIEIFDFYGKLIYQEKTKSNTIQIKNNSLTKGKYILNISSNLGYKKREILIIE